MAQFNRLKTEKEAKRVEPEVSSSLSSTNKSVIRAIARFVATGILYPDMTEEQRCEELVRAFYVDAKFQPSWEEIFKKASEMKDSQGVRTYPGVETLLLAFKGTLGTPQARGRRRAPPPVLTEPPANPDMNAVLGPPPANVLTNGTTTT